MTKLTYMVGNAEIASYAEAQQVAAKTGMKMTPKYTPIVEHSAYNAERTEKKLEKRLAKKGV